MNKNRFEVVVTSYGRHKNIDEIKRRPIIAPAIAVRLLKSNRGKWSGVAEYGERGSSDVEDWTRRGSQPPDTGRTWGGGGVVSGHCTMKWSLQNSFWRIAF